MSAIVRAFAFSAKPFSRAKVLSYRKTHVVTVQVHPSGLRPHHLVKTGVDAGT